MVQPVINLKDLKDLIGLYDYCIVYPNEDNLSISLWQLSWLVSGTKCLHWKLEEAPSVKQRPTFNHRFHCCGGLINRLNDVVSLFSTRCPFWMLPLLPWFAAMYVTAALSDSVRHNNNDCSPSISPQWNHFWNHGSTLLIVVWTRFRWS